MGTKIGGGEENKTRQFDFLHCLGPTCGIIPMGVPATLTTRGLEWNLGIIDIALGLCMHQSIDTCPF